MTFRQYVDKNLGKEKLLLIQIANTIIDEYTKQGFSLTLRQLYYQFVARSILPNSVKSYGKLGDAINDGRLTGLVSWTAIEDRTRNLMGTQTFESPEKAIGSIANSYREDLWHDQDWRPEVWVEKEALAGVVEGICSRLRVNFFACRGYNSQSEAWRAGQRFANYYNRGQRPIVFHLGDHDPSGIDMTRDNRERLALFCGVAVPVVRLALNMDQITKYNPPPNPAKMSDSRAEDYVRTYGDESWELDALDPRTIQTLISDHIEGLKDQKKFAASLERETASRVYLRSLSGG